jgi:hypothetical protein
MLNQPMGSYRVKPLGDLTSSITSAFGDTTSFDVNSPLFLAGVGLLGVALLLSFTGKSYHRYQRRSRRKRASKARIAALKAELAAARG